MIKKLTAVIVFWIFVISCCFSPALCCFFEGISVSAADSGVEVPYVNNKGIWSIKDPQMGLRIHIENEYEEVYENRYIDILRSSPNGTGGDNQEVPQNLAESWLNSGNLPKHVLWGDNAPYKIYVWSGFKAFICEENDDDGWIEVNNKISDIILRKYSSGEDENGNIWRKLGVNSDTQNELIEKGYYLVAEPLAWFYIPYTGDYNLNTSRTGSSGSYYIYGTMREMLEYSSSARTTEGSFYTEGTKIRTSNIEPFQLFSGRRSEDLCFGKYYSTVEKDICAIDYNLIEEYNNYYGDNLDKYVCVEAWGILYIMALSTRSYNMAWQVEECFKKYIRWYANDYLFDDSSNESQLWYAMRFATNSDDIIDYKRCSGSDDDYADSVAHSASPDHLASLYNELIENKFYKINCKTDILVNYINGPYRTNSEVYTTVTLKNISKHDINIGDIEAVFSADGYDIQPVADADGLRAYNTNIIAPQETAYVSLRWKTPETENNNMHFTVDISQSGNDETAVVISPVEFDVKISNMPSCDDYRSLENADYVNLDSIADIDRAVRQKYEAVYSSDYYQQYLSDKLNEWKEKYGLSSENEYNLSAGSYSIGNSFKKDNNDENLSIDFHSNYPVGISSFVSEENTLNNGDIIKSGYGLAFHLDYFGFNDYMTYDSAKLMFLYPEYGYDMNYAAVTERIPSENQECKYWLMSNPVSLYDSEETASRIHFIPEWWPDDKDYTVYWAFIDTWTPAGQIITWGKLNFDIEGSVYDDWYITRNMS